MKRLIRATVPALLLIGLSGCYDPEHGHQSNLEKIKSTPPTTEVAVSSETFLGNSDRVPVQSAHGTAPFFVAARASKIPNYPCTKCHVEGVIERKQKDAHWNIQVKHAPEQSMTCVTCHGKEKDKMQLQSLAGEKIDYNRVDQLCAQCHFQQARDWNGGAHGKRKGGWAPPRVATACTGCHDPHSPSFAPRWPSTFGTRDLDRKGDRNG